MKQVHYSMSKRIRIGTMLLLALAAAFGGWYSMMRAGADARQITCWALCKPGAQVMVRATPDKGGRVVGYLEAGDSFQTDAENKDGWIRAYGVGDGGGWVYCGYVVTDKPEPAYEQYVCVAKQRAACRKWCGGPQIEGKTGWIYNGTNVQVFYKSAEWCVTSRGYIKTEWLEVDPK